MNKIDRRIARGIAFFLGFGVVWLCTESGRAQCLFSDQQTVQINESRPGDRVAHAIAISGDLLLVGAPFDDDSGASSGAAYLLRHDGAGFVVEQKIVSAEAGPGALFGFSVEIAGDLLVIGAPGMSGNTGAAFVYQNLAGGFTRVSRLDGEGPGERFGESLSLTPARLAVGAPNARVSGFATGAVSIFAVGASIDFEQRLTPGGTSASRFGSSISVDGDQIAVGAPFESSMGANRGVVVVFGFDGSMWRLDQTLYSDFGIVGDNAGTSVALDGEVLLVGEPGRDSAQGSVDVGVVTVYRGQAGLFAEDQTLFGSGFLGGEKFGTSLVLQGAVAIVGEPLSRTPLNNAGAAFVFLDDGSRFELADQIFLLDQGLGDQFGTSVDLDGAAAVVGAPSASNGGFARAFVGGFSGSVNAAFGVSDVLFANGSSGGASRTVRVTIGAPLTVDLQAAPLGPTDAEYVIWIWRDLVARPFGLDVGTSSLGCTVSPTPLQPFAQPQPIRCLSSETARMLAFCGGVDRISNAPSRAPFTSTRPDGIGREVTFVLQGVIEDLGSLSPDQFSVTNAVVLVSE